MVVGRIDFDGMRFFVPMPADHPLLSGFSKTPGAYVKWEDDKRGWSIGHGPIEFSALSALVESRSATLLPTARRMFEQLRHDLVSSSDPAHLETMKRDLRPYQVEGVRFAVERRRAMIADDMGLGKTYQAIVTIEELHAFPCVVVCPGAVKNSWANEIEKRAPHRSFTVLDSGRQHVPKTDYLILNPELLTSQRDEIFKRMPKSVVLDEAHYFKNPESQRSRAARALAETVDVRLALTGTPIKNRREDLVYQLKILGYLEEVLENHELYPVYARNGRIGLDNAKTLLEMFEPRVLNQRLRDTCMIRRTKAELKGEIPDLDRQQHRIRFEDVDKYAHQQQTFIETIRQISRDGDHLWEQIAHTDRIRVRGGMSKLRLETAHLKIPAIVEWAESVDERVVYFCYHREVARLLQKELPGKYEIISGGLPMSKRTNIINEMPNHNGLIATMDSTGHGVDGIQHHSSRVVFVELDWTSTKHDQCEGRVHRKGQGNAVTSHYFIAENTIDRLIEKRILEKRQDIHSVIDGHLGESEDYWIGQVFDIVVRKRAWRDPSIDIWSESPPIEKPPRTKPDHARTGKSDGIRATTPKAPRPTAHAGIRTMASTTPGARGDAIANEVRTALERFNRRIPRGDLGHHGWLFYTLALQANLRGNWRESDRLLKQASHAMSSMKENHRPDTLQNRVTHLHERNHAKKKG